VVIFAIAQLSCNSKLIIVIVAYRVSAAFAVARILEQIGLGPAAGPNAA